MKQQVESLKPDLVIDIVLQSCHTYNVEAVKVESYVREDLGTDYQRLSPTFHSWIWDSSRRKLLLCLK